MRIHHFAKAEPTGGQTVDDLTIRIWRQLDSGNRGQVQQEEEAAELAEALRAHLPGGTFDRLVARLLEMKVCDFRVPRYVTDRDDLGNLAGPAGDGCAAIAAAAGADPGSITCPACLDRPALAARVTEEDVTRALRDIGSDFVPTDDWQTKVMDRIKKEDDTK